MINQGSSNEIHSLHIATRSIIELERREDIENIFIPFPSFLEVVIIRDSSVHILLDFLVFSCLLKIIIYHRCQGIVSLAVSLIVKRFGWVLESKVKPFFSSRAILQRPVVHHWSLVYAVTLETRSYWFSRRWMNRFRDGIILNVRKSDWSIMLCLLCRLLFGMRVEDHQDRVLFRMNFFRSSSSFLLLFGHLQSLHLNVA